MDCREGVFILNFDPDDPAEPQQIVVPILGRDQVEFTLGVLTKFSFMPGLVCEGWHPEVWPWVVFW